MTGKNHIRSESIGFDIGHSAVKICYRDNARLIFPASAGPAIHISEENTARAASAETVMVDGKAYFFGATAHSQLSKKLKLGLNQDWVTTPEHTALFLGGLKKLSDAGIDTSKEGSSKLSVVLGLPAAYHSEYKTFVKDMALNYLPDAEINVLPQPFGCYQKMLFNPDGKKNEERGMARQDWAVVEVGYYTTDFLLVKKGRFIQLNSPSCEGVSLATESLYQTLTQRRNHRIDFDSCQLAMKTREIKQYGQPVNVTDDVKDAAELLAGKVFDTAKMTFGETVASLDGVLIAGGGAPLVFEEIKKVWPHAEMDEDSRFSVAEGFRRYSLAKQVYVK